MRGAAQAEGLDERPVAPDGPASVCEARMPSGRNRAISSASRAGKGDLGAAVLAWAVAQEQRRIAITHHRVAAHDLGEPIEDRQAAPSDATAARVSFCWTARADFSARCSSCWTRRATVRLTATNGTDRGTANRVRPTSGELP